MKIVPPCSGSVTIRISVNAQIENAQSTGRAMVLTGLGVYLA